jgi:hypothetical protein
MAVTVTLSLTPGMAAKALTKVAPAGPAPITTTLVLPASFQVKSESRIVASEGATGGATVCVTVCVTVTVSLLGKAVVPTAAHITKPATIPPTVFK